MRFFTQAFAKHTPKEVKPTTIPPTKETPKTLWMILCMRSTRKHFCGIPIKRKEKYVCKGANRFTSEEAAQKRMQELHLRATPEDHFEIVSYVDGHYMAILSKNNISPSPPP